MFLSPQSPINATSDAYHAIAIALCERAQATLPHRLDIAYGAHSQQRLDLYFPQESPAHGLPIFLNIHGGGWTHGFKEWMGLNALAIAAFPAVYASLSYRLAPAAKHPAQVEDCLSAVAWLAGHAGAFGGDPDRIHIGGHSAGAHIAALATLRTDLHTRHRIAPGTIKSCFGFSGLYDLRGAFGEPVLPGISPVPMLDDIADEADASPILAARKVSTRFHLSWGAQEPDVFSRNGTAFAEALVARGNAVETYVPDLDHFWIHLDQNRPESEWNRMLHAYMTGSPGNRRI
jgi:arylformamidase